MRIYLLITNRCNLNCSICIRGKQYDRDLDYDEFSRVFSSEEYRNMEIVITGGEPTLHPKFVDIVLMASKYFKNVLVASNGTTDYYLEELKSLKNIIFQISLDGAMTTHDLIRGQGAFEATISTINKFEENELNYCIASVVGNSNNESILELVPVLKTLKKMKFWRVSYEMPFGNSNAQSIMLAEEWNQFVDKILEVVEFKMLIKKIFFFEIFDKYINNEEKILTRCFNCGSGKDTIYIYPNFDVYPCTCLTDFCIGNLKNDSLDSIIKSSLNKKFTCYSLDEELPCISCKYFEYCNGGCIGMSYNILGSMGKGDIRCPILRSYYEKKNILL